MAFLPNSLKLFLISTWLLLTALGLNLSLSTITHFFATHVPLTWNLCLTCLKPPYLFLLLNAIILSIAASSRFHHPTPPPPPAYVTKPPPPPPPSLFIEEDYYPPAFVDVKPVVVNGVAAAEEDGTVTSTESTWTPPENTPPEPTLEELWKAITEGRARAVKKRSETMKERRRNPMVCATTASTLRKEQLELSQDELNRRAEAFIRKFNEDMKLQKQQSLNRWQ